MTINWRHQYDEKRDKIEREATAITCKDDSMTMQSFTDDVNLNTIAKRFGLEGKPIPVTEWNPNHYGDFTNIPDLRTALEQVMTAQHNFDQLPADIRSRFYNDPAKLWEFVHDPRNHEEAVRLKILAPAPTAAPAPSGTPTASGGTVPATPATTPTDTQTTPPQTPPEGGQKTP